MAYVISSAREGALLLLQNVLQDQRRLSELSHHLQPLQPKDRAAAQRLAAEVLRQLDRVDRVLKPYLNRRPHDQVRNILRLGAVEICMGGASHGVVNEMVNICAADRQSRPAKGMVNAILRKMEGEGTKRWEQLGAPRLPAWLRQPLQAAWGDKHLGAMERAFAKSAPLDLTAKGDPAALADLTGGTVLPTGTVRLAKGGQVSGLPGFEDGAFWVQDAGAALPMKLLGDVKDQKVLDMCAAPGGKTMQLAAAGADVTALDLSEARLERVQENLARTGLKATVVAGDALEHQGSYDAILLDAPCSATGTLRRHPDLPHVHEGERIGELIELQGQMIDHALSLLKPGGRLLFATCSLIPDEGECQVEEALARHPGLKVSVPDADWIEPDWRSDEGGLRLRPDFWADRGGIDGFYMALLHNNPA